MRCYENRNTHVCTLNSESTRQRLNNKRRIPSAIQKCLASPTSFLAKTKPKLPRNRWRGAESALRFGLRLWAFVF
jgi:hypothetical protein